jgi:hypothetical protein
LSSSCTVDTSVIVSWRFITANSLLDGALVATTVRGDLRIGPT